FYLSVGQDDSHPINANDMFAMGRHLRRFTDAVLEAGAMPVFSHHFTKGAAQQSQRSRPALTDLAHAGFGQFADQWILMGRRRRYKSSQAIHELWLMVGGRHHDTEEYAIDIDNAPIPESKGLRRWDVKFVDAEAPAAQHDSGPAVAGKITART